MNRELLIQNWENPEGIKNITPELITIISNYKIYCIKHSIPIIYNLAHLSLITGLNYTTLKSIINSTNSFYYNFTIPKKNGGSREINNPYPSLRYIQKWIKVSILEKQKIHASATAYQLNKSIIDNAIPHLNSKSILKIDLENFFPSINISRIIYVFKNIGYPPQISYYLASICCLNESLPQGASTSPILSNIVCYKLDTRLTALCNKWGYNYTRYADDICISGNFIPLKFTTIIENIIQNEGFNINHLKTKLIPKNAKKKIITGISISNNILMLPRSTKRQYKSEGYNLIKFANKNIDSLSNIDPIIVTQIIGKLNFWLQIEPNNKYASRLLVIIKNTFSSVN